MQMQLNMAAPLFWFWFFFSFISEKQLQQSDFFFVFNPVSPKAERQKGLHMFDLVGSLGPFRFSSHLELVFKHHP